MLKKLLSVSIMCCMLTMTVSCSNKGADASSEVQPKTKVTVSFNAVKQLVEAIAKDKVEVNVMIPDGTEPHDYEPKAKDLEKLSNANLFVYSGLGMEAWVDKALSAAENKKLEVVEAAKGFEPIKNTDADEIEEHGQYDPHVWLSLKGAENEAKNIKDGLVKVDSKNKTFYEENYKDFLDKAEALFKDYSAKFSSINNKNFVTGHAAFGYLCRDFQLTQNSVEDVFAEGEPSAKNLKDLVDYCKENNIKTIFVEDMVSAKISDTLAKEVGARTQKIYTLESEEDNKDYIQSMKDNLENIYLSLK